MGLEPAWMEAKSHNLPSMCISTIFLSESIALCARALSKCFKIAVEEKERKETGKKWNLTRKLAPVTFLVKLRYYYRFFYYDRNIAPANFKLICTSYSISKSCTMAAGN